MKMLSKKGEKEQPKYRYKHGQLRNRKSVTTSPLRFVVPDEDLDSHDTS
jgi:hypothetical protein